MFSKQFWGFVVRCALFFFFSFLKIVAGNTKAVCSSIDLH